MSTTTLVWTAFVDEPAGRAVLVRSQVQNHWEDASDKPNVDEPGITIWMDRDGIPVVVEVCMTEPSDDAGVAATLEQRVERVLGPVSLGSPTLWGLVPVWVWYDVTTEWPPPNPDERHVGRPAGLEEAVARAQRNKARRPRAR